MSNRQSMEEARLRAIREQHSSPPPNYTLAELVFNPELQKTVNGNGVIRPKKCDKECIDAFEVSPDLPKFSRNCWGFEII